MAPTRAAPVISTPRRNCASVIDTDFTIHTRPVFEPQFHGRRSARPVRTVFALGENPLTDSTVSERNR